MEKGENILSTGKYSKDQDNVIFPRYRAKCDQLLQTNSRQGCLEA
ncbi:hypothetical protein chiPu_0019015, partial [Chiloscyllium punctatum]|nr:hypothetical protein [Chiloscyllium punctatum]